MTKRSNNIIFRILIVSVKFMVTSAMSPALLVIKINLKKYLGMSSKF